MLFGFKLANETYPPWKDQYISYENLKKLLKENVVPAEEWTEADESRFVSALDAELEKVYTFQTSQYKKISDHISECEQIVRNATKDAGDNIDNVHLDVKELEKKIEDTLAEAQELDHFSRLNFTGFLKIVKKHDRLHPKYSVKPLLQVRLNSLPFYSEDYSPLLYRLSSLYTFLRDNFGSQFYGSETKGSASAKKLSQVVNEEDASLVSYKFWIHPDNLMEVKTRILRHLPVLVYNNNFNGSLEPAQSDPTVTALYFENENFELYKSKLEKSEVSPTLRLRWSGKLADKPDIYLEKRVVSQNEVLPEERVKLKEKYVQPFLDGTYSMDKTVQRMRQSHAPEAEIEHYEATVKSLQEFIREHELQPALRIIYTRTAFQIPGDSRVRITIDSDILMIREDAFDKDRPIRDPNSWHRTDLDSPGVDNSYSVLRKGEFVKFPYAVMDIQVRKNAEFAIGGSGSVSSTSASQRHGKWIEELTSSHLVKEVPNFSKFIQGLASLFGEDDRLDSLPYWLTDLEHDIRRDPKEAWEEEKQKLQKKKEKEAVEEVLSPFRKKSISMAGPQGVSPSVSSPAVAAVDESKDADLDPDDESDNDEGSSSSGQSSTVPILGIKKSNIPLFAPKKFAKSKLGAKVDDEEVVLPSGVHKPKQLIRLSGPVKVEAKVWLANERTFNRWLHVTVLFSVLTFSIYNSVKKAANQELATGLAYVYFGLTIFTALWGYGIYMRRLSLIRARSGKHFDAVFGPLVVATVLFVSILVNFILRMKHASAVRAAVHVELLEEGFNDWLLRKVFEVVDRI